MNQIEKSFEYELEVFRKEVQSAIQLFYSYLTINESLSVNKKAHNIVNETPLFWLTNMGALQTAFFITLGRIFDQNTNHNVNKILRLAQSNEKIFSKEALETRKIEDNKNVAEWINEYMVGVYVPTVTDFRRLRKYVSKYRKVYERGYRDIRRKYFAHKELSKPEDVQALFAKTNITEMQKLLIFLNRLYLALWELFHNGRKPLLRPMKYSVKQMMGKEIPKWQNKQIQEHIVFETEKFFQILTDQPNHALKRTD